MEAFIYGSEEFEAELREDAHTAGEVEFLHHEFLKDLGESAGELAAFLEDCGYRVRPISVEALDAKPSLEECSHIYAQRKESGS